MQNPALPRVTREPILARIPLPIEPPTTGVKSISKQKLNCRGVGPCSIMTRRVFKIQSDATSLATGLPQMPIRTPDTVCEVAKMCSGVDTTASCPLSLEVCKEAQYLCDLSN